MRKHGFHRFRGVGVLALSPFRSAITGLGDEGGADHGGEACHAPAALHGGKHGAFARVLRQAQTS
eukprot:scaffold5937_cov275-Pinguiococcus_pyrenoidosus.AAC.2